MSQSQVQTGSGSNRVLVVDDDESVLYSVGALLEEDGYIVDTAVSGEAALNLINGQAEPFAAVIADIWMPGMSGLELLQAIRQRTSDLPVILLTGQASLETSIEAVNQGASGYLLKPFRPDAVIAALERAIQQAAASRQVLADQAAISDLIRGLRHELGNLATVLNLDVSLLEQTMTGWDNDQLNELKDNVNDLGRLLGRLRDYPQPNVRLERLDLVQVLHGAVEHARAQVNDVCPGMLHWQAPDPPVWVNADESNLFRVLVNVLDNAIEANLQVGGEWLEVTLSIQADQALIAVSDHGPGFSAAMLHAPFSPASTTKVTDGFMRGLGLGLFISNAVMRLHSGTITLANRPEGGARVTLTLPLLDAV